MMHAIIRVKDVHATMKPVCVSNTFAVVHVCNINMRSASLQCILPNLISNAHKRFYRSLKAIFVRHCGQKA